MRDVLDILHGKLYKPLPLGPNEIRILTFLPSDSSGIDNEIRCSLKRVSLDGEPSYTTLSYTWGEHGGSSSTDGQKFQKSVLIDGETFPITMNLYLGLQRLRQTDPDICLWVDAICIDQRHEAEQLKQIDLMHEIYSRAQETRVWLGPEADDSEKAVALVRSLSKIKPYSRDSVVLSDQENKDVNVKALTELELAQTEYKLSPLDRLFARDYWYRAWVIQEIAVSKNVRLFCGNSSLQWDEVLDTAYLLDTTVLVQEHILRWLKMYDLEYTLAKPMLPPKSILPGIQRILSIQSIRNDHALRDEDTEHTDSLLYLLSSHRYANATKPGDKYLALSNLVGNKSILTPVSSRSVRKVYLAAAQSIMKQQVSEGRGLSLDFLDCAGLPTKGWDLPSWVPDWSYDQPRPTLLLNWQLSKKDDKNLLEYNATGTLSTPSPRTSYDDRPSLLEQGILLAQGVRFDVIESIGTLPGTTSTTSSTSFELNEKIGRTRYPTDQESWDVIWKSCFLNRTQRAEAIPQDWGDFLCVWLGINKWWRGVHNLKICGKTLESIRQKRLLVLMSKADTDPRRNTARYQNNSEKATSVSNAFTMATAGRILVVTMNGYICLSPANTEAGDLVAVLYDCSVPVVLRKADDHYIFIGTCYVHEIMHGEVAKMQGLEHTTFEIR